VWIDNINIFTVVSYFVSYLMFLCSSRHFTEKKKEKERISSAFLPLFNYFAANDKVPRIVKTKGLLSVSPVCHSLFHETTA